jgi:hypothetical protein
MTNHNPLFASKKAQFLQEATNIKTVKSIHTNIFDASKDDFFEWLFRHNEIEMAEYAQRVVDHSGDNIYFQIPLFQLRGWFNAVDEDDDCFEMLEMFRTDIENLIKFCEENEIDYIIES